MNIEKAISRYFGLKKNEDWLRHANPYSVFTRIIVLPLFAISIWSRLWIGWYSLIGVILLIVWTFVNPRLFPEVKEIRSWWSKCVIGEYLWTNRDKFNIPAHHYSMINILTFLQGISGIVLAVGLYKFDLFLTLLGTISVYFSKMWFLDRMVWIYQDLKKKEDIEKWLKVG